MDILYNMKILSEEEWEVYCALYPNSYSYIQRVLAWVVKGLRFLLVLVIITTITAIYRVMVPRLC